MDREEFERIASDAEMDGDLAHEILLGEADNYDGADGARYVLKKTQDIAKLVAFIRMLRKWTL